MRNEFSVLACSIALSAVALFAPTSTQTFCGEISDSMCGSHHMMKSATAAQCTRKCVK